MDCYYEEESYLMKEASSYGIVGDCGPTAAEPQPEPSSSHLPLLGLVPLFFTGWNRRTSRVFRVLSPHASTLSGPGRKV